MADSDILVSRQGDHAFVKVVGRGSFQNASAFKSFYEELLDRNVHHFDIDLEACTYLDSTFLGNMTGLGMKLRKNGGRLHILKAGDRNLELMQNLGIDRLFAIDCGGVDYTATDLKKIDAEPADKSQTGTNMLEAHENLVKAEPENEAKFKDVIAYLKEDLDSPGTD